MRKLIFYILLLTFHFSRFTFGVFAQLPTEEWVVRYLGPSNDLYGPFLAVDKQGNSYIAGTHVINDSINILCAKYNTLGVQLWATLYKYPGEGYFAPAGLALDSSGNAYVISRCGQGYTTLLNSLIVKFNSLNGSPVWAKKYVGEYGWSSFLDLEIDRLNNIYVAGWSDTSHLVIRYNTNGDSVWVRKFHPPSAIPPQFVREVARACTIDDSLNIIFTGIRMHYYPPFGNLDSVLVAKYSSGGVLRWESVYAQGVSANLGIKIASDQNGNLYIGGGTVISGDGVYLTLKYDRNGVLQWTAIYDAPGSGSNYLNGIAMDRINNAILVTGTNGLRMATTIKYNIFTGDSVWVKRDTGIYSSSGSNDIIVDTSGNAYITGSTYNYPPTIGAFMTVKYSSIGNGIWMITYAEQGRGIQIKNDYSNNLYVLGLTANDYVLIKYNQLLGIKPISNEIPNEYKLFQNYPNPFNAITIIRFSIPKKSFVQLRIYDILGRLKELPINEEMNASEYELTIDGSSYSSGVYFYQLIADGNVIDTKKMIVLK